VSSRTVGFPQSGWRPWLSPGSLPSIVEAQVLAHIPPARCGLLPGSLTIFCDPPWSGSVSGGGVRRQPPWPRAPLPSWGVTPPGVVSSRPRSALPDRPRSYGLMRQTTPLPQPVVVPRSVGLCRLVRVPAGTWSFPTLSLRVCPSMRGPLPRRRGGCMYPLLPHHHRPSPSPHGVGFPRQSVQRLPNGR
jgi:hypothetical protein